MQMLSFIEVFSVRYPAIESWLGAGIPTTTLLFNPIRLVFFIGWVYLCFYCVQRVQYSLLVPKEYKTAASITSFFIGPIVFFVMLVVNVAKKSLEGDSNIIGIIKGQLEKVFSANSANPFQREDVSGITLLDSAGNRLEDIYGQGKKKRQANKILELTEQIIGNALDDRASDILIDPKDNSNYTIRYRVDGVLRTAYNIESTVCQAVINSIKVVSGMDIAERRRPQDGSFKGEMAENMVSFRVASAGVRNGEKLSIRVLDPNCGLFKLEKIGLSGKQCEVIKNAIVKPSGMILLCGPTGSGKTTTLYAMLNEIDLTMRNVITVEDPIEYTLPEASQIEVNPKADITFANSLRSILRQDPDVICIGEIRDEETANIALRASQTGHLVVATIHCNTSASALVRLLDLGVSPVLLSSGLSLVISQRLLRQLCEDCKRPARLSQGQIANLRKRGVNYKKIYQVGGCDRCEGTGYYGRIAICDIMVFDDKLKADIGASGEVLGQLRSDGEKKGKSNLHKRGMKKVLGGVTSFDEIKRVVG